MVKKTTRSRVKSGRKKGKGSSFAASIVKRLAFFAFAVALGAGGALYLYDYLGLAHPVEDERMVAKTPPATNSKAVSKKAKSTPERSEPAPYVFPDQAEIPELRVQRAEQIIRHEGYTVSYNSDYRIANWVAYELTAEEAKGNDVERSNKFVSDPMVKGATATNEDYTRTGYDRGHLAPAGDMKWSMKAMRESFYLSNICPQVPDLNRGIWKDLEEQARLWAKENGALLIVAGPVLSDDLRRLGKNRVGIPRRFYKVICTVTGGQPQGVGFLFDNKDYGDTSLRSLMIPIDSVEVVTGIDFFPSLPDSIERPLEAKVDASRWSF